MTYFFKKNQFWRFDDESVKTEEGYPPQSVTKFWLGCDN
jgi:hypothetical protein